MNYYILYVILSVLLMNNPLLVAMDYETTQEKKEEKESESQEVMELVEENISLEKMQQEKPTVEKQREPKKRKAVDPIMLERFKKAKQMEQNIRTTYGDIAQKINLLKPRIQSSPVVGYDEYKKELIALITYQEKIITAFLAKPITKERNDSCDQRAKMANHRIDTLIQILDNAYDKQFGTKS